MWKNHLFYLQAIAAALNSICKGLACAESCEHWSPVHTVQYLYFRIKMAFNEICFYIPCTFFIYEAPLEDRHGIQYTVLGSLAVSSKCPWGDSRLQFLGPSFPWEDLSWPPAVTHGSFLRYRNHRLSFMWLQGSLMWTQVAPEMTSGYPWPWVASGVISDYPRHHQRLKFQRITTYQAQLDLRLAWPELFSLFLLRVWRISSVVLANEWG